MGSAVGGLLGGGQKSSSQTTTNSVPAWLDPYNKSLVSRANKLSKSEYTPYTGQIVADFNADQNQAFDLARGNVGQYQNLFDTAGQQAQMYAQRAGQGPTAEDIQRLMNPYVQNVLDVNARKISENAGIQAAQNARDAAVSGAFGGSGNYLTKQALQKNTQQLLADNQATGMADAYDRALASYLQGNQDLAGSIGALTGVAGQGQAYNMADLETLLKTGTVQQQADQQGLDFDYQQFLEQREHPYDQLAFLSNIVTPQSSIYATQQTDGTQANGSGSTLGNVVGTAASVASLFSDERVKENIKEVGELDNGLPVYKYNYKGSPQTQIGVMAQDVEKVNPKAVSEMAGIKMVNYDSATKKYADGGRVDPAELASIIKSKAKTMQSGPLAPRGAPNLQFAPDVQTDPKKQAADFGAVKDLITNLSTKDATQGLINTENMPGFNGMLGAMQDVAAPEASFWQGLVPNFSSAGISLFAEGGPVITPETKDEMIAKMLGDEGYTKADLNTEIVNATADQSYVPESWIDSLAKKATVGQADIAEGLGDFVSNFPENFVKGVKVINQANPVEKMLGVPRDLIGGFMDRKNQVAEGTSPTDPAMLTGRRAPNTVVDPVLANAQAIANQDRSPLADNDMPNFSPDELIARTGATPVAEQSVTGGEDDILQQLVSGGPQGGTPDFMQGLMANQGPFAVTQQPSSTDKTDQLIEMLMGRLSGQGQRPMSFLEKLGAIGAGMLKPDPSGYGYSFFEQLGQGFDNVGEVQSAQAEAEAAKTKNVLDLLQAVSYANQVKSAGQISPYQAAQLALEAKRVAAQNAKDAAMTGYYNKKDPNKTSGLGGLDPLSAMALLQAQREMGAEQ